MTHTQRPINNLNCVAQLHKFHCFCCYREWRLHPISGEQQIKIKPGWERLSRTKAKRYARWFSTPFQHFHIAVDQKILWCRTFNPRLPSDINEMYHIILHMRPEQWSIINKTLYFWLTIWQTKVVQTFNPIQATNKLLSQKCCSCTCTANEYLDCTCSHST